MRERDQLLSSGSNRPAAEAAQSAAAAATGRGLMAGWGLINAWHSSTFHSSVCLAAHIQAAIHS